MVKQKSDHNTEEPLKKHNLNAGTPPTARLSHNALSP